MKFVDPPKPSSPKRAIDELTVWKGLLKPLATRRNIGRWALVRHYENRAAAASAAYDINARRNTGLPPGRWTATARATDLYVKYLGEPEANKGENK